MKISAKPLTWSMYCVLMTMTQSAIAQNDEITALMESITSVTQSTYSTMIAEKLKKDGTGESTEASAKKGFVPTSEEFVRRVTFDSIAKNKRTRGQGFTFAFAPGGKGALSVKLKESSLSGEKQALMIAKILDSTVRSIRATYTAMIVHKMKNDGFGATLDYTDKKGFVPLPAVFARTIAGNVVSTFSLRPIEVSLRSRWNLNKNQNLQIDFEREGWDFLVNQQVTHMASGKALRKLNWQPYVKVENADGKQNLRYLSADVAASKACISCHNNWEQQEDIKELRKSQGVEIGKEFNNKELMGALSILVQVDN